MSPFHHLGEFLRGLFLNVPMAGVRVLFLAVFVVVAVWVWRLPAPERQRSATGDRWFEDLRIWALLALSVQFLIYLLN